MKDKIKILHITPHLGGGVGAVILNWLKNDKKNNYSVITLDFANENAIKACKDENIELLSQPDIEIILNKIKEADIVILHFWNHPLLYDFIIKNELPDCRLIIWSHISGLSVPNVIPEKIFNYPDKLIYTTPISNEIKENDVILSTSGVEKYETIKHIKQETFTLGYIGTVDYSKMHPEYISTLSKIKGVKVIIVGGNNEKEVSKNAPDNFEFIGKVSDVTPYLSKMDVFAYLLNPKHFGTAEQVLQEAMTAGVVPVVLNNKCEKSLVKHNITGLAAQNSEEYIEYIELLKQNEQLRKKLSLNAKKYAKEAFSTSAFLNLWNETFIKIMKLPKTKKSWGDKKEYSSYDIFLESLGEYKSIFVNKTEHEIKEILKQSNWQSNSKGTPKQYYEFLGGERLKDLINLY